MCKAHYYHFVERLYKIQASQTPKQEENKASKKWFNFKDEFKKFFFFFFGLLTKIFQNCNLLGAICKWHIFIEGRESIRKEREIYLERCPLDLFVSKK